MSSPPPENARMENALRWIERIEALPKAIDAQMLKTLREWDEWMGRSPFNRQAYMRALMGTNEVSP